MRYAEWCIAAPTLEADIAAAAMGLDDIGHSRVLYGSLRELGTPDAGTDDGASYANVPFLDQPWRDWSEFVAANAVLDSSFTLMMEALANGNVDVLRTRLKKMLQEERYHTLHGRSWMQEVNAGAALTRTSTSFTARVGWRTACATCAGYSKSGSRARLRRAGSSGAAGNRSAGEPSRAASTRRRSTCCRGSPKSGTCRRVDELAI